MERTAFRPCFDFPTAPSALISLPLRPLKCPAPFLPHQTQCLVGMLWLFCGPGPVVPPVSETCSPASPLRMLFSQNHCSQQWLQSPQPELSTKGRHWELLDWLISSNSKNWQVMNIADGEQTIYPKSLSFPQGSHRDSRSPFLTLWAWLPSTLGK